MIKPISNQRPARVSALENDRVQPGRQPCRLDPVGVGWAEGLVCGRWTSAVWRRKITSFSVADRQLAAQDADQVASEYWPRPKVAFFAQMRPLAVVQQAGKGLQVAAEAEAEVANPGRRASSIAADGWSSAPSRASAVVGVAGSILASCASIGTLSACWPA